MSSRFGEAADLILGVCTVDEYSRRVAPTFALVEKAIWEDLPRIKHVPNRCLTQIEETISHPTGSGFACSSRVSRPTCTPTGFVNKPVRPGHTSVIFLKETPTDLILDAQMVDEYNPAYAEGKECFLK
jgi:hypothetical protein